MKKALALLPGADFYLAGKQNKFIFTVAMTLLCVTFISSLMAGRKYAKNTDDK